MKLQLLCCPLCCVVLMLCSQTMSQGQETKFANARDAYNVGVALLNAKKYKESEDAFNQALELADKSSTKIRIYRALISVYRKLPNNEKMFPAVEYLISNSDHAATQSLTRRVLLSFIQNRGLVEQSIARYQTAIKTNPKDTTALYILSEIYGRLKRNPQRKLELVEQWVQVQDLDTTKPENVEQAAAIAQTYASVKKYKKAAELYQQIAPLNEKLTAWHWKEAAIAWLKDNQPEQALNAAKQSAASNPEQRSKLLTFYWHEGLADTFLELKEPDAAIKHYQQALEHTNIDLHKKMIEQKLAQAKNSLQEK